MIRILPMDKEYEFSGDSVENVQEKFFLTELPSRNDDIGQGKYCYKTNGMNIDKQTTLVLFQYENKIIASARLYDITKFDEPEDVYYGAFYFEPTSIQVFKAISNEEINNIFQCKKKFGQVKHYLDTTYLDTFMSKLLNTKFVNIGNLSVNVNTTCVPNNREN